MRLTGHAITRMNQRGITSEAMDLILRHGSCHQVKDGGIAVFLGNKESQEIISGLKKAIQLLDKAKNGMLIIKEDCILTTYKRQTGRLKNA